MSTDITTQADETEIYDLDVEYQLLMNYIDNGSPGSFYDINPAMFSMKRIERLLEDCQELCWVEGEDETGSIVPVFDDSAYSVLLEHMTKRMFREAQVFILMSFASVLATSYPGTSGNLSRLLIDQDVKRGLAIDLFGDKCPAWITNPPSNFCEAYLKTMEDAIAILPSTMQEPVAAVHNQMAQLLYGIAD